jgi:5-methylcytosine-specific restriction endonuclease McrA
LRWNTDELACLKMLAYCLRKYEAGCRSPYVLWQRTNALCPQVMQAVLNRETTFEQIRRETYARTGIKITPNRLYQRADKTGRYQEFNLYLACVEAAYRAVTCQVEPVQPRTFTDEQLWAALRRQGGRCFYCGCDCSGGGVVGDHIVAVANHGKTVDFNCAASCVRCNEEKGAMSPFEYGKLVGERNARGRRLNP